MSARIVELAHEAGAPAALVGSVGYLLETEQLRLEVWSYGATVVAVEIPDGSGGWVNVVRRHPDPARYTNPRDRAGYLGATIGRYANRIASSSFVIDGRTHHLTSNEGSTHLHGGQTGFDQQRWSGELDAERQAVTFELDSPDGDQGYPGHLRASVRYRVDGATLELAYEATCDAPTVVSLTNHAYWNLAGGGPIADHELAVAASRWLPIDDKSIPIGGPAPVEGTRFDLRQPTSLSAVVAAGGIDHCFLLDGDGSHRPAARLTHPPTGRALTVATDQPALQVYSANRLEPPHTALCLETQRPPDAPNQPDLGPSVLRPGETYRHRTTFTFSSPTFSSLDSSPELA